MARSSAALNPRLRKLGKKQKWLPAFTSFIRALRIQSKEVASINDERGGSELELWQSQQMFLECLCEGLEDGVHEFYILKSRGLGITTIGMTIILFWAALHPNMIGCLVSDNDGNREGFREIIRSIMKSFPEDFVGSEFTVVTNNKYLIKFSNGAQLDLLVAGQHKENWSEGKHYTFGWLTEVSKYGSRIGINNFIPSMAQLSNDRLFIWESPLSIDTPLPTPSGWTTMGEVKEGDVLFDEKGRHTKVIGTSPVFHDRKCYQIDFNNGDSIIADECHIWRVQERRYYTNQQWTEKDLKTSELIAGRHFIEVTSPLSLPEITLPIDPYLLGVWLGDGATAEPRITAGDDDIAAMLSLLEERGCVIGKITKSKNRAPMFFILGVRNTFIKLGLLGDKHIPPAYLRASEEQRRLLLAGLMDTDGYVDKTNYQCTFASTNFGLINNVSELLSSLGIKHKISINSAAGKIRRFPQGHDSVCRESWRIMFSEFPDLLVFQLPRKRTVHEAANRKRWRQFKWLNIIAITEVPSVPVKCVAVDTPSHLFLAGKTMIPTHNTANGFANHWHDLWLAAGDDHFTKRRRFIGWWAKPANRIEPKDRRYAVYARSGPNGEEAELIRQVAEEYGHVVTLEQLAWYRWKESDKSQEDGALDQNEPWTEQQAFVQTGSSFFQMRLVQKKYDELLERQELYRGYRFIIGDDIFKTRMEQITDVADIDDVELRLWEDPIPEAQYVIGCDPAYGRTDWADRHCISVWRCYADRLIQVAEYADANVETHHCAWVLAYMAGAYRQCMINLELGGPGRAILREFDTLKQIMKSEVYAKRVRDLDWDDFLDMARWYLYHRPDSPGPGYAISWETTWRSKVEILNQLRDSFTTGMLDIHSLPLLDEMSTMVQDKSDIAPEGAGRNKDDRVFAAALANRAWIDWIRGPLLQEGATYEVITAAEQGELSITQQMVKRIVYDFWRNQEDRAQAPETPTWLHDRGFI